MKFPTTVKEHRDAAQTYLEKAKAYRIEAGIHREMKAFYEGNDGSMSSQCDQIIKRFDDMADDMERFAKWHEEQGKKGTK